MTSLVDAPARGDQWYAVAESAAIRRRPPVDRWAPWWNRRRGGRCARSLLAPGGAAVGGPGHRGPPLLSAVRKCSSPVEDETSRFTFGVWRNDEHTVPAEQAIAFDPAMGEEDRQQLELLDGELPLDRQATVSVRADRSSVEWRRRLRAMVSARSAD